MPSYELTYIGCCVVYVENAKDQDDAIQQADLAMRMGDWEHDEVRVKPQRTAKQKEFAKRHAMVKA